MESLISYKFKGGQSSFAIKFFKEAWSTGRLSYTFNSPVKSICDQGKKVTLTTRDGRQYTAARLVSTIPLNVLSSITFDPPLDPQRVEAVSIGHVNQCVKVHAEITSKDMRSWTGISYPFNKLTYALGDGTTPAGNTHIVCFGGYHNHIQPEENINKTKAAVEKMAPGKMDIKRLVRIFTNPLRGSVLTITIRSFTIGPRMNSQRERGFSRPLDFCRHLWMPCGPAMVMSSLRIRTGRLVGAAS